ncbi:putative mucin TcMUCII [Trypanosoma cruzi]|uniref:Mucin TcMUCII, putative n=2 Tax=Trypanosoma cruzi TaxID=5693 RepID=Q4DXM6_TRYCC|nr:mucin TcMUCII, putative [Trypanosoma cruzi]EAN97283.1 mucin TcMUCII, putative [Trypanosoma cruzi]PWV09720.1 putative mucin TcMUCII [Trypanosoma cruzi]RNC39297.1 mucin TcMUCII [Trypanosoma cruzi]|eukprot:XP_819134.1 mucin TcMUCII [Trypanosoma cruzi strain CL Brener]
MMMKCRLLCALLVLVLCCCPSVCAADVTLNEPQIEGNGASLPSATSETNPKTQNPADTSPLPSPKANTSLDPENEVDARGKDTISSSAAAEVALRSADESGSLNQESGTVQGNTASSFSPAPPTEPSKRTGTDPEDKDNSKKIVTPEDISETTTTTNTTKSPTTTTTTTTAPEAPSTTTTHTPSRLREIDGSLSSSAWVCAPLVLAVCALAYTAVG